MIVVKKRRGFGKGRNSRVLPTPLAEQGEQHLVGLQATKLPESVRETQCLFTTLHTHQGQKTCHFGGCALGHIVENEVSHTLFHYQFLELGVAFLVLEEQVHLELSVAGTFGNALGFEFLKRLLDKAVRQRVFHAE